MLRALPRFSCRRKRFSGRSRAFVFMYRIQDITGHYFVKNASLDASGAGRTAENGPKQVFLIWKYVIFGEPQYRGYFRESSYEEAVCGTRLVRSSSNHGLIPYFENVHFWWTAISGVFPRELIRRSGLGDPPLYRVVAIIASFLPWKCSFLGWFRLERKCRSKCGKRVLFKCCWDHFLR